MNDSKPAPKPRRPRRRRALWVICFIVGTPAGYFFYHHWQAGRDLAAAIAELDRSDPGWRLADIEAARRKMPNEKNSAQIVLAARRALPRVWQKVDFYTELDLAPPCARSRGRRGTCARGCEQSPERSIWREN